MKRIVLILFLLCYISISGGHPCMTSIDSRKKIVLETGENCFGEGTRLKNYLLIEMFQRLNKSHFQDSVFVYVRCGMNDYYYDSASIPQTYPYLLGYRLNTFKDIIEKDGVPIDWKPIDLAKNCVSLDCFDGSYKVGEAIRLIYAGILNKTIIQQDQKEIIAKRICNDDRFIQVFPPAQLQNLSSKLPDNIDSILHLKFYRRWIDKSLIGDIDYYLQNDSFHIYKIVDGPHTFENRKNVTLKEVMADTLGIDLFKVPNITRIVTDTIDNYLIFLNSFTFLHYRMSTNNLSGPFKFPSIQYGKHYLAEYVENRMTQTNPGVFKIRMQVHGQDCNVYYYDKAHFVAVDSFFVKMVDTYQLNLKQQYPKFEVDSIDKKSKQYQMLALAGIVLSLNAFLIWRSRR